MIDEAPTDVRHTAFEDAHALVTGALFVGLGLALFGRAGLLTGGTAGIAFLIHYATGWNFGALFFAINLPFYWLAVRGLGWQFTLKTFVAVALVSIVSELLPLWLAFERINPIYAAVMGGFLVGAGLLMFFRHHASLGGVNVLVLFLQDRHGWRAGKVQMAIDSAIVLAAFAIVDVHRVVLSVLGALALNLVIAINHRPGRYLGV